MDFNPDFSFQVPGAEEGSAHPWEFKGALLCLQWLRQMLSSRAIVHYQGPYMHKSHPKNAQVRPEHMRARSQMLRTLM